MGQRSGMSPETGLNETGALAGAVAEQFGAVGPAETVISSTTPTPLA